MPTGRNHDNRCSSPITPKAQHSVSVKGDGRLSTLLPSTWASSRPRPMLVMASGRLCIRSGTASRDRESTEADLTIR